MRVMFFFSSTNEGFNGSEVKLLAAIKRSYRVYIIKGKEQIL